MATNSPTRLVCEEAPGLSVINTQGGAMDAANCFRDMIGEPRFTHGHKPVPGGATAYCLGKLTAGNRTATA